MQQHATHILSLHTPAIPGAGSKVKIFFSLKVVMLHIKLEGGMEHRALCKHMLCPDTHPRPPRAGLKSKHFFLKVVMLHVKFKGMGHRAPHKHIFIFCSYRPPRPPVVGSKVKTFFLKVVMLHIKLKGMEHRTPQHEGWVKM